MMPGGENYTDPPVLAQMLARAHEIEQLMIEQQMADRRTVLAWAPILCSCERRYVPGSPSWADCLVHGVFLIHPDGTTL